MNAIPSPLSSNDHTASDWTQIPTPESPDWEWEDVNDPSDIEKDFEAYTHFSQQGSTIAAGFDIDNSTGQIRPIAEPLSGSFGGRLIQIFFLKHKPHVDHFYSVLKRKYGEEVALWAFPPEKQHQAAKLGLTSKIVFDTLKKITLKKVAEIALQIQTANPQSSVSSNEEKIALLSQIENLKKLITELPDASELSKEQYIDTRNTLTTITSLLTRSLDLTMTAQSSIPWVKRAFFLIQALRTGSLAAFLIP